MPTVRDFRKLQFEPHRVDRCGKYIGRNAYWKLYAIENLLRVVIHSVLSLQIDAEWWDKAVDPKTREKAEKVRKDYLRAPLHATPGGHDIYYVFLPDLNRIILANSNLFLPVVPDIDQWVVKIESVRLPRNVVAHMNFPNEYDRHAIDRIYGEFGSLVARLQSSGVGIHIP